METNEDIHLAALELLDQLPFPFLSVRHLDWARDYAEITAFLTPVVQDRYSK